MNSWFTVKVKYTKQLEDGTFKRVSEPYLVAAMTFTDAEARIYEELGSIIRGEFTVTHITRTDVHDIFHFEDADTWYKCVITYEAGGDGGEEGAKAKKVSQTFLVTAHTVENASERLKESLGEMMIDYNIKSVVLSPLVDIFPFGDDTEDSDKVANKFAETLRKELGATGVSLEITSSTGKVIYNSEASKEMISDSSDQMPYADIALSEGYTLYNKNAEFFPDDGEWVNVIFTDGQTNQIQFGNNDVGFIAEMRDGVSVLAWKSINQYSEKAKASMNAYLPSSSE